MKRLEISDEVYESLKAFVVDPFSDTPNAVLMRLIHIANKAQNRWSPFATPQPQKTKSPDISRPQKATSPNRSVPAHTRIPETEDESKSLML